MLFNKIVKAGFFETFTAKRLESTGVNFKEAETGEVVLRGQLQNIGFFDGTGMTLEQIAQKADELVKSINHVAFYRIFRGEGDVVSYIVYKSRK